MEFQVHLVSSVDLFIKCFHQYQSEIKMMSNVSKMKTSTKKKKPIISKELRKID